MILNRLAASPYGVHLWLLLYAGAWVLIPYWSNAGLPLDVVEQSAWGREWPLGLYRHPPMKVWLQEIAFLATGGWLPSVYLVSALAFVAAQLALYALLRDVHDRTFAFIAVVLSGLVFYFGVHLPQWNANIAQYPFAALFLLGTWRALTRGSIGWWLLAAVAAAGGLLSKFTFVLIPACLGLLVLIDPYWRSRLRPVHLAASLVLFAALVAPTLWWTFFSGGSEAGDFIVERTGLDSGRWSDHLMGPLVVIGATLGVLVLPWIAVRFGIAGAPKPADEEAGRLETMLAVASFGPLLVIALGALVLGVDIKDHWLLVNFLFLPPWLLSRGMRGRWAAMRFRPGGEVLVLGAVLVIMLVYPLERQAAYWRADGRPMEWTPLMPAAPLVNAAQDVWDEGLEAHCLPPLPLAVVGGESPAAIVASTLPTRAQWFDQFEAGRSPWVDVGALEATGALAIGPGGEFFADYGLVRAATRQYDWPNSRGGEGTTIEISAWLPQSVCQ